MNITFRQDKKEKTFNVTVISARMLRRTIEINKTMDLTDMDVDTLDAVADYIADVFEGQFTRDEVYSGLSSYELIPTFQYLMGAVVSKSFEAIGGDKDPNVRAGE